MPPPYGVTLEGFNPMSLDEIKTELEDDFRTAFGQNVQVHARSVNGQLIGIMAERYALLWAELQKIYVLAYLGGASGSALDDLVAIVGITRLPATYSTVTLRLGGDDATVIPVDSRTKDAEGLLWIHTSEGSIAGGIADVTARAEETGPRIGLAGTLTVIDTPITGWDTVTNLLDAEVGRDAESDADLRTRTILTLRAGGGSSVEAIQAAILRLDEVTECLIVENETAFTDSDGRPPKSFETVVRGGADQDIVDTIWIGKPAGIETHGSESGTAVDSAGDPHTIEFSRPTELDVWIIGDIEFDPDVLPSERDGIEALVELALLEHGETFNMGTDVVPFKFLQHVETERIKSLELRVGLAPNPPSTTPITIDRTDLAVFDSSRISFNRLN